MTELLYQTDSYLREADAVVTAHAEVNGAPAAVLSRTILYPGGGGQPADTGTLSWDGHEARVTRAMFALEPGRVPASPTRAVEPSAAQRHAAEWTITR